MKFFEDFAANRAAKKAQEQEEYNEAVREHEAARQSLAKAEAEYARLPEILDEVSRDVEARIDADKAKRKAESEKLDREVQEAQDRLAMEKKAFEQTKFDEGQQTESQLRNLRENINSTSQD